MATHLTDASHQALADATKGNRITYDDDVKGFGCRVTPPVPESFVLNYVTKGGRERRYTIGGYPDWQTTAARAKARELRRLVDDGGDPLADIEHERAAPTVADLIARFEQEHLPRLRPSSQEDYRRMLASHIRPHFGAAHESGGRLALRTSTACTARSPQPGICTAPTESLRYQQDVCARDPLAHA